MTPAGGTDFSPAGPAQPFVVLFLRGCRDAGRVRGVNSVSCRISGANAPCGTMPHMSRPGCEPARCVNRAVYSSPSPGRGLCTNPTPGRQFVPTSDIAHAGGLNWEGAPSVLSAGRELARYRSEARRGLADGGRYLCARPMRLNPQLESAHEHELESKAAIPTDSKRINSAVARVLGAPGEALRVV